MANYENDMGVNASGGHGGAGVNASGGPGGAGVNASGGPGGGVQVFGAGGAGIRVCRDGEAPDAIMVSSDHPNGVPVRLVRSGVT